MRRFDPSELVRFGGLGLVARRLVEGYMTGIHRSPYKGFSVEFAEHRAYYPGDEIRHVDWRAYGKTDRYFVKEYEEETNLRAMLVLDASGSMKYRGAQATSKFEYARQVAASLAYLLFSQRDAVGLLTHDTTPRLHLPPKTSSKHLLAVLRALEESEPGGETSLAANWELIAARHLTRRGLVVLLSDAFDQIEPLVRAMRHLRYRRHDVILFQIVAPEEIDFPFRRPTRFRNLEIVSDERQVDVRRMREEYRKNFADHTEALRRATAELHIDYQMLRTDQPVERALGLYLTGRG